MDKFIYYCQEHYDPNKPIFLTKPIFHKCSFCDNEAEYFYERPLSEFVEYALKKTEEARGELNRFFNWRWN